MSLQRRIIAAAILYVTAVYPHRHPLQELIEAARTNAPALKDLIGAGLPALRGRDVTAVWGQEFLFAVESDAAATVSVDKKPPLPMAHISGSKYWYRLMTLRLGTTHTYTYFADGKPIGTYDVVGYNPDSYPLPGAPRGKLPEKKTLSSRVYPGMDANYWVYVNDGAETLAGARP